MNEDKTSSAGRVLVSNTRKKGSFELKIFLSDTDFHDLSIMYDF